jgi:hypothetical protein
MTRYSTIGDIPAQHRGGVCLRWKIAELIFPDMPLRMVEKGFRFNDNFRHACGASKLIRTEPGSHRCAKQKSRHHN